MTQDLSKADVLELNDRQKEELNLRIVALRGDPDGGSSWDEVKARIRSKE